MTDLEDLTVLPAVQAFEASQLKDYLPPFKAGDSLRVHLRIVEGERSRLQVFEGVCIGRSGSGVRETVTIRRTSYGLGMERVLPLHSPIVEKIEVTRRGRVRRGKLYYLRSLTGKKARITEASRDDYKKVTKAAELAAAKPEVEEVPVEPEVAAVEETPVAPEASAASEATPEAAPEEPANDAPTEDAPAEETKSETDG